MQDRTGSCRRPIAFRTRQAPVFMVQGENVVEQFIAPGPGQHLSQFALAIKQPWVFREYRAQVECGKSGEVASDLQFKLVNRSLTSPIDRFERKPKYSRYHVISCQQYTTKTAADLGATDALSVVNRYFDPAQPVLYCPDLHFHIPAITAIAQLKLT